MKPVTATWWHVLRVWFAFTWRAMGAYCLLCGIGFVTTIACGIFAMKFAGWSAHRAEETFGPYYLAALALAIPLAGLFGTRLLLKAKFAGFSLAVLSEASPAPEATDDDAWLRAPHAAAPVWNGQPQPRGARSV